MRKINLFPSFAKTKKTSSNYKLGATLQTMITGLSSQISLKVILPGFWFIFVITLILLIASMLSYIDHDDSPGIGLIAAPIILPAIAAIITIIAILFCDILGFFLRKTPLRVMWEKLGYSVLFITIASLLALVFNEHLGLNKACTDWKGTKYSTISDLSSLICYFLVVFPIVNLPYWKKSSFKRPPPIPIIQNNGFPNP